jgi:hypothetical protein
VVTGPRFGSIALAALLAGWSWSAGAQRPVDLELVLAVDSSGSVDGAEFALQMQGIAAAFRDPAVIRALEVHTPQGIAVALMHWSGRHEELVVLDWTLVSDASSAGAFAERVAGAPRRLLGTTAIADAIHFAMAELRANAFAGTRRAIDLSGDGMSNAGGHPRDARDAAAAEDITINGLAILNEQPALDLYYEWNVIGGPAAFVIAAADYDDFARAMRLKLLREIESTPLARGPSGSRWTQTAASGTTDRTAP